MTKSVLALFSLVSALVLAGCAAQIRTDHSGADAGRVVVGLGATEGTPFRSITLYYRRIDPNAAPGERRPVGAFTAHYGPTLMRAGQPRDYSNDKESGVVLVHSVPAGDYELHSYKADTGGGYFYPTQPFSIRFAVRAGEAVYLGNYQTNSFMGQDAQGQRALAGARYVVSNRIDSEVVLARTKMKDLPAAVSNATPDLRAATRNSLFVAAAGTR